MPADHRLTVAAANGSAADAGRLITFPLSHLCEKARWALDHAGLTFKELRYWPAIHKAHVVSRGSTTVPVLISPEGTLPALHPPGYGGARLTIPPVPTELAPRILAWLQRTTAVAGEREPEDRRTR